MAVHSKIVREKNFLMQAFSALWSSHPTIKGDAPLLDRAVYDNQCAINVSAAWLRSGMNFPGYTGVLSWEKDKPKYPIRAQELANWFASPHSHLRAVEKFGGKKAFNAIRGRTGIIFFQNYWGAGNQGDHIDLWNGTRLTDWTSWLRIQAGISIPGFWSDFKQSESVWLWQIP